MHDVADPPDKASRDFEALIRDFREVAELAGVELPPNSVLVEIQPAPHKAPPSMPKGKTAVYVFLVGDGCLKVGKVGSNSQARYTSQHYLPASSNSNLAKSILGAREAL